MKENTFIALLSVAVVTLGSLIVLAEVSILCKQGMAFEEALITSLYTGFIAWIILASSLMTSNWFSKLIDRIIKK